MKKIIFKMPDGRAGIISPAYNDPSRFIEDESAFLRYVIAKDVPPGCSDVRIVDVDEIPKDRRSRDNWRLRNGKVSNGE